LDTKKNMGKKKMKISKTKREILKTKCDCVSCSVKKERERIFTSMKRRK